MNSTAPLSITYTECVSSQIHSFGYDATTHTLGVRFHSRGNSIAEPPSPTEYHYFGVPQETADAFAAAESKGSAFAKLIRGKFAYEKQPDAAGIVFGLSQKQEPKYTVSSKDGRIVNRSTGVAIPDDEPVFILRAKDVNAAMTIQNYLALCKSPDHRAVVNGRLHDFIEFAMQHPDRMKEPDASLQDISAVDLARPAPAAAAYDTSASTSGTAPTPSAVARTWNGPVTSSGSEA